MGKQPATGTDRGNRAATDRGVSRRQYLALQSLALAGLAAGSAGTVGAQDGDEAGVQNEITVDPDAQTDDALSDQLFGRLCEHYSSGTIYPGVYSQHVKNPTFFPRSWSEDDFFGPRTFYDSAEIDQHESVPFPWEPVGGDGVTFEERDGGAAAAESTVYPRIDLDDARGGMSQKTVLPDFRTLGYDLAVSVRGDGVETVTASIRPLTAGDDGLTAGDPLASTDLDVGDEWERREAHLELDAADGDQYIAGAIGDVETPYGQYVVEFAAEGSGHVDLDFVELAADDAIRGKFNPSTVELMCEQNCTWLKWPGGNFTSQYNWRDGVGPLDERPARFNHAWGGVEPNFFGTDEYLELCEVADLTPRITVGWWDNPPEWASERQILPEDAADWVEYCNGSAGTDMGRLRKEHGRAKPWDVQYWEVGNEVWGPWQRGHTADPSEFATGSDERIGFDSYYDAMTAVDDDITVLADGMDPGYDEAETPDPDHWNGTLFAEVGDRLDGLDIHRYNWGIEDDAARQTWYEENDAGPLDYNEVLVMFPTQFADLVSGLAADAADAGIEDFRVNVGEYGLFPTVDDGAPYPGPETMPGGAYVAGMLNAFVRQSETVVEASQTWVPVRMFPPVNEDFPPDPNPLAPAGSVFGLYAAAFETDAEWHAVDVEIGGDGREIPDTGPRIEPMDFAPYVDAAAMRDDRGGALCAFLTNRNLRTDTEAVLDLGDEYAGRDVEVVRHAPTADERPLPHAFQQSWDDPDAYAVETTTESVGDDGVLTLSLEPAAVVRLYVDGDEGRLRGLDDDGVWEGLTAHVEGDDCSGRGKQRGYGGEGKRGEKGKGDDRKDDEDQAHEDETDEESEDEDDGDDE